MMAVERSSRSGKLAVAGVKSVESAENSRMGRVELALSSILGFRVGLVAVVTFARRVRLRLMESGITLQTSMKKDNDLINSDVMIDGRFWVSSIVADYYVERLVLISEEAKSGSVKGWREAAYAKPFVALHSRITQRTRTVSIRVFKRINTRSSIVAVVIHEQYIHVERN